MKAAWKKNLWEACFVTVLCLSLRKNGKLQFAASPTRISLTLAFKQNGITLLGFLFIFSSITVCLQILATWTLTFYKYYSNFIPFEYEHGIGKNSHLSRQNSRVSLWKNPEFHLLSLKFPLYLFYYHTVIKWSRRDLPARKSGQNLGVLKSTETQITAVRLKKLV